MRRVASSTPTIAGRPISRAMTAPWLSTPPISVIKAPAVKNSGVQAGADQQRGGTQLRPFLPLALSCLQHLVSPRSDPCFGPGTDHLQLQPEDLVGCLEMAGQGEPASEFQVNLSSVGESDQPDVLGGL